MGILPVNAEFRQKEENKFTYLFLYCLIPLKRVL